MKKLLSLPPNLVDSFHDVTGLSPDEYFCTCDPVRHRLGSGGGTAWLLKEAYKAEGPNELEPNKPNEANKAHESFLEWLASEKRILLHAGTSAALIDTG